MQPRVLGLVHHAHAATAQLLDDAVVRNDLIDHWIEMLGVEVEQVNEERERRRRGAIVGLTSP